MEIICHCAGKAWRLVMRTHDAASTAWLESAGLPDLPAPTRDGTVCRYEALREVATDSDRLIEVDLAGDGTATGSLAGQTIVITNRPPRISRETINSCGDAVRVATPEQVFRLALHWFVAWDHLGCVDLDDSAFFDSLEVTAYAVDPASAWLDMDAPLPIPGSLPEKAVAVFLAWEGLDMSFQRFQRAADLIEARLPAATLAGGLYPGDTPGERCLVGIGISKEAARD